MNTKKSDYREPNWYRFDAIERDYLEGWQVYGDMRYVPDQYMEERWWYTDYPGYFISDYGRLFNANTGRFLKPKKLDNHGHLGYGLYVYDTNGNRRVLYKYAHRLVAKAFIENEEQLPIVRHIDDDPSNNEWDNLMWGTQRDNHYDSVRNKTYRPITDEHRQVGIEKVRRPVLVTKISTGEQRVFRSINDAVRSLGVQQANAVKVLSGQRAHTCGYFFEYLTREEEAELIARGY